MRLMYFRKVVWVYQKQPPAKVAWAIRDYNISMKKWLGIAIAVAVMASEVGVRVSGRQGANSIYGTEVSRDTPTEVPSPTMVPSPTPEPLRSVLLKVPFTSQAPFGEWSDPRHQDGCEEAAVLMAVAAAAGDSRFKIQGTILDKQYAKEEIENIWDWEVETYGGARDTSAQDTADRIIGRYFWYKAYSVREIESGDEIARELMKGNIVITPMDGRKLGNPNFTQPGPERHMVLVRGYDAQTDEFVTNDPGTRKGELYRYPAEVFFRAIRDYPTGDHVPIVGVEKRMIVVEK